MKIVVLAGGISTERQVSLVSGTEVCKALRENGNQAILIDLFMGLPGWEGRYDEAFAQEDGFCGTYSISSEAPDLDAIRAQRGGNPNCRIGPGVLELCQNADLVFLGLHGADGEDGRVQAMLELYGIPYTGSGPLGSAMAMDKAVTKRIMEQHGIRTPGWQELSITEEEIPALAQSLPMPCVVKTPEGGSSIGVMMPESREELENALKEIVKFDSRIIVEEKIVGRELAAGVLNGMKLPAVEIIPQEGTYFDYASKYQSSDNGGAREVCPAPITAEQAEVAGEMALKLHNALGLSVYSRADLILDANGDFWCLEINTLPGMTPASLLPKAAAVHGVPYNNLCQMIAELSLQVKR